MINTFIAALVAIFFWGKSSNEVEEKTEHASGLRTLVYLVLSIVVGVFFYKTYQVAVVYNIVDVDGIRQGYDEALSYASSPFFLHQIQYIPKESLDSPLNL